MNLSLTDLDCWLRAVTSQPARPMDMMRWITGPLKAFFPFEKVLLGHGELVAGQIQVTHVLADGHEADYLQHIGSTFDLKMRGSMHYWLTQRQPFALDPAFPPPFATEFELNEIREFRLGRVAAHGILNAKTNAGTYFSFAGIPVPMSTWHLDALKLIAPVLNDLFLTYVAVQQKDVTQALALLTPRQKEIVRLIAKGEDDKAIAKILGIAEKTVRNHLTVVYTKLGMHKRAQLIALLRRIQRPVEILNRPGHLSHRQASRDLPPSNKSKKSMIPKKLLSKRWANLTLLVALCMCCASVTHARTYGNYDLLQVVKKTANPPGGSVDMVYVDAIINDLRSHAENFPPQFDNAADAAKAKRDVVGLMGMLDVLAKEPGVPIEVLIRLGVLGHIGYNLQIPDIASSTQLYFAKALTAQPNHPLANYRMGLFLAQSNQLPMAVSFFENAKRLGYKSALYSLGLTYMSLKENAKALENLAAYQALYPNDANTAQFIKAIQQGKVTVIEKGKP